MESFMIEKELKMYLRDERDRLLEIKKNLSEDDIEALRLINKRLDTIQENLED